MQCTLRGIFQEHLRGTRSVIGCPAYVHRAAHWSSRCRTAELGGHVRRCPEGHVERVIYTTNALESVNARLRKITKTRGPFPSDEAASKLIWLAVPNITAKWSHAAHGWKATMNQFAILYRDRFTRPQA
jgi:transposase-like protein